jgi:hypothetical protein
MDAVIQTDEATAPLLFVTSAYCEVCQGNPQKPEARSSLAQSLEPGRLWYGDPTSGQAGRTVRISHFPQRSKRVGCPTEPVRALSCMLVFQFARAANTQLLRSKVGSVGLKKIK